MDMNSVIQEIETWPVADQIRLVEQLSELIAENTRDEELTEDFKMELQRRVNELDSHPELAVSWSEVKAKVMASFRP